MKSIRIASAIVLMIALALPAAFPRTSFAGASEADEPWVVGIDPSLRTYDREVVCAVYPHYVVKSVDVHDDEPEIHVVARKDRKTDCSFKTGRHTFVADGFLLGLAGRFMLVDHGTTPGIRDLDVRDLEVKGRLHKFDYLAGPRMIVVNRDSTIRIVMPINRACPNPSAFKREQESDPGDSLALLQKMNVDLASGRTNPVGKPFCKIVGN